MVDRPIIEVKALAYLPNRAGSHHLVWRGRSKATGEDFHRFLGGGVELLERSHEAVVREIREELGATMEDPVLLGVLENIFDYPGGGRHQIVFVYGGRLAEGDVVPVDGGTYYDLAVPIRVEWRPMDDSACEVPLFPLRVEKLLPGR